MRFILAGSGRSETAFVSPGLREPAPAGAAARPVAAAIQAEDGTRTRCSGSAAREGDP